MDTLTLPTKQQPDQHKTLRLNLVKAMGGSTKALFPKYGVVGEISFKSNAMTVASHEVLDSDESDEDSADNIFDSSSSDDSES